MKPCTKFVLPLVLVLIGFSIHARPTQANGPTNEMFFDLGSSAEPNDIDVYFWNEGADIWINGEFIQLIFDFNVDPDAQIYFHGGNHGDTVNIFGYTNNDMLISYWAGDGNDEIYNYSNVPMHCSGGEGNDTIQGGSADDEISGEEGNDTIFGGAGNDNLHGHDGMDEVDGGPGNDIIRGGRGVDQVFGGPGDDQLAGGNRHEIYQVLPDFCVDTMEGGPGQDEFRGAVAFYYFFYQKQLVPIEVENITDFDPMEDLKFPSIYYLFFP